MPVLAFLIEAAEAGLLAPEISSKFTYPEDRQRRMAQTNTLLRTQQRLGRALRAQKPEASVRYHNVPAYRWYITSAGVEYYVAGGYKARATKRALVREQRIVYEQKLLAYVTRVQLLHTISTEERNQLVLEMYLDGITKADIGLIVRLTRERVRQIVNEFGVQPVRPSIVTRRRHPKKSAAELEALVRRAATGWQE